MCKLTWLLLVLFFGSMVSTSTGFQLPFSYNEDTQGDLSNDPTTPSALAEDFLPVFALQGTINDTDYDIFTIDFENTGIRLNQIILEGYSGPVVSFIGVQSGTSWTAGLGAAIDATQLLGWTHFGSGDLGSDLLAPMGMGAAGAIGFTPPLEDGTFTFLIQDIGQNVNYTMRLESTHSTQPDINEDAQLTTADIDELVVEIVNQSNSLAYDYNCDNTVDVLDLYEWLAIAGAENLPSQAPYLVGDANLDGTVDGQDFVAWNASKFTAIPAWSQGDFNADGFIDGQDFVLWNANKFMSADSRQPVPEPSTLVLLLMLGSWVLDRAKLLERS